MSMSKFTSQADYWKDRAERAEAKLAELEKQEPAYFVDEQGLLRKYTSRDFNQCNYGGLQRLYARPVPAEKGIVTVTTNDAGRWVMVSRQDEDHRILSVIWEAKDVPTEPVTVAFGKRGKNMFFKIGNQSFLLDYKPEEQAEFDFMKEMLLSAFYRITQGVKTEIQPVNARLLEAIKRLSFCAQTTGGTAGRDEGLCAAIGEAEKAIAAAEAVPKEPVAELPVNARLLDVAVWPAGYCRDPNGKMSIPAGKEADFNFGYDVGFQEAWEIMNSAISAAGKSLTPQQERPSA